MRLSGVRVNSSNSLINREDRLPCDPDWEIAKAQALRDGQSGNLHFLNQTHGRAGASPCDGVFCTGPYVDGVSSAFSARSSMARYEGLVARAS